jgi:GGDEF domain-containing protein
MSEEIGEALIQIDSRKGVVLECTQAAIDLLAGSVDGGEGDGAGISGAVGMAWHKFLGVDKATRDALEQAFVCDHPVQLPPFILSRRGFDDVALSGLKLPAPAGSDAAKLVLWRVTSGGELLFEKEPRRGDCIAVMGADRLRVAAQGGEGEAMAFMSVLRQSLSSILRPEDSVSSVMGTSLTIVLRETDMEGARDVCRAYLSHLHRTLRDEDTRGFAARLRVGLSRVTSGRSFVSALLAADRAMLQARRSWNTQQVRGENAEDFGYLLKDAIQGAGVFSAQPPGHKPEVPAAATTRGPNALPARELQTKLPDINPMEKDIAGYVTDNMEGAVDQAAFLGKLDTPVAIIGSAGTGKMYVARVFHEASGAAPELLVQVASRLTLLSPGSSHVEKVKPWFSSPHIL